MLIFIVDTDQLELGWIESRTVDVVLSSIRIQPPPCVCSRIQRPPCACSRIQPPPCDCSTSLDLNHLAKGRNTPLEEDIIVVERKLGNTMSQGAAATIHDISYRSGLVFEYPRSWQAEQVIRRELGL